MICFKVMRDIWLNVREFDSLAQVPTPILATLSLLPLICNFVIAFFDFPDIPLPSQLPQPCSVHHLVQHYLDINSVPRRSFFEFMALFTTNELEKEKLQEFCTPEGQVFI